MAKNFAMLKEWKARGRLTTKLYEHPDTLALGRFTWEMWVANHPSVVPCDVTRESGLWYYLMREHLEGDDACYTLAKAPRHDLNASRGFIKRGFRNTLWKNKAARMKEYFILPGQLFKFINVYNSTPPSDSWIYDWFPDGHEWRDAIEKYGSNAVDVVTKQYAEKNSRNKKRKAA